MADTDGPAVPAGGSYPPREIELRDDDGPSLTVAQQFHGTTGPQVWDAGIVLLRFLATAPVAAVLATHPRVVELGSGTGVVGIAAAALGGDVVMTDLPELLPLLHHNITLNAEIVASAQGSLSAAELRWGKTALPQELVDPDLILLSDCVFETAAAQLLVETLEQLCTQPGTTVLLANEQREHSKNREAEAEFSAAAAVHFTIERVGRAEQDQEYACDEIVVLRLRRKATSRAQ
jgi:predicted nicotinamide N-methyase